MYCKHDEPGVGAVASAAFPENRKPIVVEPFRGPVTLNSYWDGGSRDVFALVDLETLRVWHTPSTHPAFDRLPNGERCGNLQLSELPANVALVQGGTFCGKPATVRVMLNEANLAKLLPSPNKVELTIAERKALNIVCSIRGSYRQDEFSRSGLGRYSALHPAIVRLAELGFLKINAAGAVSATVEGRNADCGGR